MLRLHAQFSDNALLRIYDFVWHQDFLSVEEQMNNRRLRPSVAKTNIETRRQFMEDAKAMREN